MISRFGATKHSTNNRNKVPQIYSCADPVYIELKVVNNETALLMPKSSTYPQLQNNKFSTKKLTEIILKSVLVVIIFIFGIIVGIHLLFNEKKSSEGYKFDIFTRDAWNNNNNNNFQVNFINDSLIFSNIIISQTDEIDCYESIDCLKYLQNITDDKLLYNFLISRNGQIYEIQGWSRALDEKQESMLIAFIGASGPNDVQFQSLNSLIIESQRRQKLKEDFQIYGI